MATPFFFANSTNGGNPTLKTIGAKPLSPSTRMILGAKLSNVGLALPLTFLLRNLVLSYQVF